MHHDEEDHASAEFTPLPDEVYNIVATLHEKSQALAAYEYYVDDATDEEARNHIEHMVRLDQECIQMCEDELVRLLKKYNRWG